MRYVDISGWIENGMWSYSSAYPGAQISECPHPPELPDDYAVYCQRFELGGQSGTYIETKAHVDPTATPVSDCPIADFVMEAVVLRIPTLGYGMRSRALNSAPPARRRVPGTPSLSQQAGTRTGVIRRNSSARVRI